MSKEYTKFGDKLLQREAGSANDWEEVPADDLSEAQDVISNKVRGLPTAEPIQIKRAGQADFQPWRPS